MLITFGLTVIAWVFFRAENIGHALDYTYEMFKGLAEYMNYYRTYRILYNSVGFPFIIISMLFFIIEWIGREQQYALENLHIRFPRSIRYFLYLLLATITLLYSGGGNQEFIYFQF